MRKMLGAVGALSAIVVSGCASTEKVLSEPATETFRSPKSQDEMVFCLADRNNVAPLTRDDGSKVILLKNGYGATALTFTVWPDGSGSRVEYRKKFGIIGGAWKRCVGLEPEKR